MVAQDGRLVVAERVGDALALLDVEDHARCSRRTAEWSLEERAGVLGDRVEQCGRGSTRPGRPAVGVGGRLTSGRAGWTCEWMAKAATLTGQSPSTTSPWWFDQDEVGGADEVEGHEPKRIDPEAIGPLGVAGGEVAGDALVEAEAAEQPEGGGQPLLDVGALLLDASRTGERVWGAAGSHQGPPVGVDRRVLSPGRRSGGRWRRRGRSRARRRGTTSASRLIVWSSTHQSPAAWTRPTIPKAHGSAAPAVAAGFAEGVAGDDGDLPADAVHEAGDHVDALGPGADVLDEEPVEVGVPLDERDVGVDRRLEQFTRPARGQRRGDLTR